MKFIIRKMKPEDTKQVQQVAKTSWNATYEGIIPQNIQERFLKSAYNDEMMERRLEHSLMLVAEEDGKIVGFANFSKVREGGKVELAAIYLYPEFQGKGIGTALLNEGIARLEGIEELYINVERDNVIGKTFYEAKGFETVEEFDDDFDGHILKTIRMVLKVR
ncbi:GNAT family N-acetyltransferase [Neobacillus notoginsengisoli]|uniref:GNAT family N-acetyltransferase n=1 Tax=Neobacillus notoginsengisoli TaxID=1578198 RepID=A0A417Z000_9BACI|nr:GNAT family N-acetyltransferase [Neobacillus notoginsengisoli]RHW43268.1 GNAT family N-acetyltransferase [Neobacillus notoginsengisoli]